MLYEGMLVKHLPQTVDGKMLMHLEDNDTVLMFLHTQHSRVNLQMNNLVFDAIEFISYFLINVIIEFNSFY